MTDRESTRGQGSYNPEVQGREEPLLLWQPASLVLTRHNRETWRGWRKIIVFVKTNIETVEGSEVDVIKEGERE